MSDLTSLPLAEIAALLRQNVVSARELVDAHLERITARDHELHAFVHVDTEGARRAARLADRELAAGIDRGALHGIPLAVKDLIDTAGVPTGYGSRLFPGHVPTADAAIVQSMRAMGAIMIGKVDTYEFATVGPSFDGPHPPSRNPWNTDRITGGSSSGSAAAVSGGLVRAALGTDTGGSVRSPASYCGVVGLKPTYGTLPVDGVYPLSPRLDHVGVIGATVADTALAFRALAEGRPGAGQFDDLTDTRVAYAREWFASDPALDPLVLAAVDRAADALSEQNVELRNATLPEYQRFEDVAVTLLGFESFRIHRDSLATNGDAYGVKTRSSLIQGEHVSERDAEEAASRAAELTRLVDDAFADVDVILTATTLTTAPAVAEFAGTDPVWTPMRTIAFNVTGHPSVSVPAGLVGGMPVGVQLVGRRGEEERVLAIAELVERRHAVGVAQTRAE